MWALFRNSRGLFVNVSDAAVFRQLDAKLQGHELVKFWKWFLAFFQSFLISGYFDHVAEWDYVPIRSRATVREIHAHDTEAVTQVSPQRLEPKNWQRTIV